jgi:hypothetical protein
MPVRQLLFTWFSTPVAIIKKLYPILGKEETLKLVKEAVWENVSNTPVKQLESWDEFGERGASELVLKTTEREDIEVGEKEIKFKIVKCMWSEVFSSLGAPEIGEALVCESDFPRAKAWSPNLKLERTQTIMTGAPFCDFRYAWKET